MVGDGVGLVVCEGVGSVVGEGVGSVVGDEYDLVDIAIRIRIEQHS